MKCLLILFCVTLKTSADDAAALQEFIEELTKTNDNFVASPVAAEIILALIHSGVDNEIARKIRSLLHLPNDRNRIEAGVQQIFCELQKKGNFAIDSATKMFITNRISIRNDFQKVAFQIYGTDLEYVDFSNKNQTMNTINEWVQMQTNDKIRNITKKINEKSTAILLNTLHFKTDWSSRFLIADTKKGKFYKTPASSIIIDMVYHINDHDLFNYCDCLDLDAKFLELPFQSDFTITIALPNKKDGLASLEKQTDKVFSVHKFRKEAINFIFPKFMLESETDLKQVLQNMSLSEIFIKQEADFSKVVSNGGDFVIDDIVLKTSIDFSGDGSNEALNNRFSGDNLPFKPTNFIVDHPFLFFVKFKNVIIFIGRVKLPNN